MYFLEFPQENFNKILEKYCSAFLLKCIKIFFNQSDASYNKVKTINNNFVKHKNEDYTIFLHFQFLFYNVCKSYLISVSILHFANAHITFGDKSCQKKPNTKRTTNTSIKILRRHIKFDLKLIYHFFCVYNFIIFQCYGQVHIMFVMFPNDNLN